MAQERPRIPANLPWEVLDHLLTHGVRLLTAISCCILLVIITIKLSPRFLFSGGIRLGVTSLPDNEEQASFTRAMNAAANAFLFLGMIITVTVLVVTLFYYRYYTVIGAWITLACAMMLVLSPVTYVYTLFKKYNVPADIISVGLFVYNFMALGVVVIRWKGPLLLQQFYLVVESAFISIFLLVFLPAWTLWVVLCLIPIWDLVAVLSHVGPLRILVKTLTERKEDLQAGMVFSTSSTESGPDARGLKMGLGDFVFYSVLVGKVSTFGDWAIVCACFVGILVGVCATLFVLAVKRTALPALPVSMAFGLTFAAFHKVIRNFMNELYVSQAFI
ncbi:presenilin-1-like [Dermacentor albipictus]|uniref:presenilin-1-like n=1 Tax=Dermacentor albipictus TaxID=60249 RepID=UPI0031FDB180